MVVVRDRRRVAFAPCNRSFALLTLLFAIGWTRIWPRSRPTVGRGISVHSKIAFSREFMVVFAIVSVLKAQGTDRPYATV